MRRERERERESEEREGRGGDNETRAAVRVYELRVTFRRAAAAAAERAPANDVIHRRHPRLAVHSRFYIYRTGAQSTIVIILLAIDLMMTFNCR